MLEASKSSLTTRACDGCRLRKVKCYALSEDLDGANALYGCRRCSKLKLTCTFDQVPRARGRKKRQTVDNFPKTSHNTQTQLHPNDQTGSPSHLLPDSQPSSVLVYMNEPGAHDLYAAGSVLTTVKYATDHLCNRQLFKLMLDDYFCHIYPLVPLVHRPSLIENVHMECDASNKDFHSLLVGVVAMVVAILPKRFDVYKVRGLNLFESRNGMVDHCFNAIMSNRGSDYFNEISHRKWAIAYCMRIAFYHTGEHNRSRMMDVESMQIARLLGFHDVSTYVGLDCIEAQLRKKAFWLTFYAYVHNQLQCLRKERLSYLDPDMLQVINLQDLLPVEADDEMIFEDRYEPQPLDVPCTTSGFIIHSRVFWAALRTTQTSTLSQDAEVCSCHRAKHPQVQIHHLRSRLRELKYMLDAVPIRLRQWAPVSIEGAGPDSSPKRLAIEFQYVTMRANLHSTQLWLQSILLDQLDALLSSTEASINDQDVSLKDNAPIWAEREEISRQLLHVLHGIPQANLEPNGMNITEKIRDVAVGLLSCPYTPEDEPAKRAAEYVKEFAEIITRFDLDPIHTSNTQSWIDTARSKNHKQPSIVNPGLSASWT